MAEVLSTRALNRALLARQGLLERWRVAPLTAIERLVGLQAQAPQAPYAGLFAPVAELEPEALSRLLAERAAVRRARVFTRGAVLVDGFVAGAWRFDRGRSGTVLRIEPLRSLGSAERTEVEAEAERLLAWHEPRGEALGVDLRARRG